MSGFATVDSVYAEVRELWRPPPRLSLSAWADENFYLSAESAAAPGKWTTLPYQRGMLDAITDPRTRQVSVMKSARVGYTKCVNAMIGFYMQHAPCPILVVQPTVDDAKGYSKEEIAPMLRDVPVLSKIAFEDAAESAGPREGSNTILHKRFPGGILSMTGANSGAGFRRISRKVVIFDEVDAYPLSAGSDGDPINLGIKRTEYYFDRKIIAGSTPLIAGVSRIEQLFNEGDQRRYFVPCPHCGHFDFLVFREREDGRGHWMQFTPKAPEDAHFVCSANGCVIEHKDKRAMVERGEWRADRPFTGHASFHLWAAYSYSPNATWADIAREFLTANAAGSDQLKTFINTTLGETWKEVGESPDWQRLYLQRETYEIGSVPDGVKVITCGVDVQKDRFVYEVVGWGANKESWSIDAGVLPGSIEKEKDWAVLDELLCRTYGAAEVPISRLVIDSGYQTNNVYNWARRWPMTRVVTGKGVAKQRTLLSSPTAVDVTVRGRRLAGGHKVWPLGVAVAKGELYGFLALNVPTDGVYPFGFCHFPQYGEDFFKQLTSEQLVTVKDKTGHLEHEWHVKPNTENHYLDARVYARAGASMLGIDRMVSKPATPPPEAPKPPATPKQVKNDGRFQRPKIRATGWLRR